jgi:hypothetical protein
LPLYDPRCRPWFKFAINYTDRAVFTAPYLSAAGNSIYVTIAKYFEYTLPSSTEETHYGVAAIDMNMTYYIYKSILETFPDFDHYFILDLDLELIIHSRL